MTSDEKIYEKLGLRVGSLVDVKNKAYGAAFDDAGRFLSLLYPAGIQPNQYGDALALVRIFDKMKRIATDKDALGESPYQDIAGYGLLGLRRAEGEKQAMLPVESKVDAADLLQTEKELNERLNAPKSVGRMGDMEFRGFPPMMGLVGTAQRAIHPDLRNPGVMGDSFLRASQTYEDRVMNDLDLPSPRKSRKPTKRSKPVIKVKKSKKDKKVKK